MCVGKFLFVNTMQNDQSLDPSSGFAAYSRSCYGNAKDINMENRDCFPSHVRDDRGTTFVGGISSRRYR